ncbi:MAG: hypothetical protein R3346_03445 [Candidatus Spechtbacterales bacterium]|nr:hypothetical protein [Candidatus Spechtbacterales bacterium]
MKLCRLFGGSPDIETKLGRIASSEIRWRSVDSVHYNRTIDADAFLEECRDELYSLINRYACLDWSKWRDRRKHKASFKKEVNDLIDAYLENTAH